MDQAATSVEIKSALAQLKSREAAVTQQLNDLISSHQDYSRELGKLDLIRAQLGSQVVATRGISNDMLSDAASTARRISGAVQRLDLEQARVKATLEVVEQVSELKACVHGVTGSMGAPQDWETAAGYLNRASKIPQEIICGPFAEKQVPSVEVPDPPRVTLDRAAESLCGLFLREFEKAAKEDNGPKVTRFFKLFPLIGRSEVGLNVYGRYVCQGVATHARANLHAGTGANQRKDGFFYSNALTKLFEYIAQIVDRHGGLVERHYGDGRMVRVIERLQAEADVQGGIIIDTWSDERNIDRKLTDIRSYAFTFLVQSFLPSQASRNPISRSGSPATFDRSTERKPVDDEGIDMKDVDGFLSEIAVMLGRWSLYCRFIATKCAGSADDSGTTLTVPPLLSHSALMRKVSEKLVSSFNIMSTFYFRRSVEKAFQLDEAPSDLHLHATKPIASNPPHITSAVDDVMYIVNQVLQRALATAQRDIVASVLPTVARVLGADFVGMIQRKMRDEVYPKPAVPGGMPPEATIVAFLVQLNNLDVATDYVRRIIDSHLNVSPLSAPSTAISVASEVLAPGLSSTFPFGSDAAFVASSLRSLRSSFEAQTAELMAEGVLVIFRNVAKPRLRPLLADALRDVDYTLSAADLEDLARATSEGEGGFEVGVAAAQAENTVPARFRSGWDALSRPLSRVLTSSNFDRLLSAMVTYVAEALERRTWGYHGKVNALGAVRLERDVAGIVGVVVKEGKYALRDSFTRCSQICTIMNMEEDEWDEVKAGQGERMEDWKIDGEEKERARAMVRARRTAEGA